MLEKRTVSQCISSDWCKGYNAAVDEMPKWINRAEELPPTRKGVLGYVQREGCSPYQTVVVLVDLEDKFFIDGEGREVKGLTHWMPLPEPPEQL